jgi:hypothetical protein
MDCKEQMHELYTSIIFDLDHATQRRLPLYREYENQKYWSWRTSLLQEDNDFSRFVRKREPWNSDYNIQVLQNYFWRKSFTCPGDLPGEKNASYVRVTGAGTVWTELQNGTIHYNRELENMILFIETSEPQRPWTAPGDDITPEEVIRFFNANPGLVKNDQRKLFSSQHWPKHFMTLGGKSCSFDTIKNDDELKKRLIIPTELFTTLKNDENAIQY